MVGTRKASTLQMCKKAISRIARWQRLLFCVSEGRTVAVSVRNVRYRERNQYDHEQSFYAGHVLDGEVADVQEGFRAIDAPKEPCRTNGRDAFAWPKGLCKSERATARPRNMVRENRDHGKISIPPGGRNGR